jgi:hypothetical protein
MRRIIDDFENARDRAEAEPYYTSAVTLKPMKRHARLVYVLSHCKRREGKAARGLIKHALPSLAPTWGAKEP